MNPIVFPELTEEAVRRIAPDTPPRLRELMEATTRHLHALVREVELTESEWLEVVKFLTATGQMCSETRQEFVLLSDVLGLSMLVDAINHAEDGVTESTVWGPFYTGLQPVLPLGSSILKRPEPGEPTEFSGSIFNPQGEPIEGALIEVWQTAPNGLYDVQDPDQPNGHLRASFTSGPLGAYRFTTVLPTSYAIPDDGPVGQLLAALGRHPNRPAHLHFMISAPDHRRLVTHLFMAGDPWLESDAVFGVKGALIVAPQRAAGSAVVEYDFVLAKL